MSILKKKISEELKTGKLLHKVRIGPLSPDRLHAIQNTLRQEKLPSGLILP